MPYPVAASRNRNFGVPLAFAGAYDDVPSIVAAYGMRRLRAAYTGSILRIRRSSDNAEQDIGALANGDLNTAAIATFVGGGSGYIVNWYDQSGNAYTASQSTAASQPLYVASGQNGKPVGRFDGTDDNLNFAMGGALAAFYAQVVGKKDIQNGARCIILWESDVRFFAAQPTAGVPRFNYSGLQVVYNPSADATIFSLWSVGRDAGNNVICYRNGDGTAAVAIAGNFAPSRIGYYTSGSFYFDGDIAELIICNAALSDANRQAAEAASNAYWAVY